MTRTATLGAACVLLALPAFAQTPSVVNGTLDVRAAQRGIDREVAAVMTTSTEPVWLGYAVSVATRHRQVGCWSPEGRDTGARVGPLKLEGPDHVYVLVRVADRRVRHIRVASPECPLDSGGLRVVWLSDVRAADSLDWLTTFTSGDSPRNMESGAIMAIALHADPQATDRLIALARRHPNGRIRGDALFSVAQRAGDRAIGAISEALDDDPDTDVKKKAVFALSQLPKDEGVPKLIEVARAHVNPAVRRQAMFWLGQSGDPRALAFFEQILQ